MNDSEKKIGVYFLMHEELPNIASFLRMSHELHMLNFDDDNFQRVMILNPYQIRSFLSDIANNGLDLPSYNNFHEWIFAGFMIRTLNDGRIE